MHEQEYYNAGIYEDTPATSMALANVQTLQPITVSRPNSRAIRKIEYRGEIDSVHERTKARLTQEVIVNTTALSALGDQAIAAVPSAEKPVRHVINVYAASSAQRIAENW